MEYSDAVQLDREHHDMNLVIKRVQKATEARKQAGIEVAEPQLTRRSQAESTPRSSNYFGSGDSIAASELYSSIPPGYTSTDDSSCRVRE